MAKTSFEESWFLVKWAGECDESFLLRGWDAVHRHVIEMCDPASVFIGELLADEDNWRHIDCGQYDTEHRYYLETEIGETARLEIVRITEDDELATLRAKAAAWDELVQRLKTACRHHIGRESLHRAGQVVIDAVNTFTSKDHPNA